MPSYRHLENTPESGTWVYKHLVDIQILEAPRFCFARLVCEHDCDGEMFTSSCSERNFVYLEPYAQWLRDNKADPYGVEKPVIPIFFNRAGRAFFSVNGAWADHSHLPLPRKRVYFPERGQPSRHPELAANSLHWLQHLFRP